jgi:iron complex transport system substrate-binding protein
VVFADEAIMSRSERVVCPDTAVKRFLSCWLQLSVACTVGCRRYDSIDPAPKRTLAITAPLTANLRDGCADHFASGFDYFPDKSTFRYARQVRVSYHGNYKVVDFTPAVHTQETFRYVLVQCGTPPPSGYRGARFVQVPAGRFVMNDAAYGSAVVRLGLLDQLVGISSFLAYTTPEILARKTSGSVCEVASRSHSPLEATIAVDPDLVFLFYSAYPNANLHPQLWRMGVEGVPMAGHFESNLLARSEWIKLLALFFNREREAEALFNPAAERYEALAQRTKSVADRPEVLLGFPSSRDVWALNGGRNFMASLVWDAGGHYFWNNKQAGSLVKADYERILDEALGTGVWLGTTGLNRVASRQALVERDPRLAFFTPMDRGGVYASNRGMDQRHAQPYADQSLDKPDVVLADVTSALHPELLPGYQPEFFRKLP